MASLTRLALIIKMIINTHFIKCDLSTSTQSVLSCLDTVIHSVHPVFIKLFLVHVCRFINYACPMHAQNR